jgi:hypothetical protein
MRAIFATLGILCLSGCTYGGNTLQVAPGSEVGGTGDIRYTHEVAGNGTNMLTVYVAPGLMETEVSMATRMSAFANKFAAQTCPRAFSFVSDPNPDRRVTEFTTRQKLYVFRCT